MSTQTWKDGTALCRAVFFLTLASGCGPEIALHRGADGDRFVVHGVDRQEARLEVFVAGGEKGQPPLFGAYQMEDGSLVFRPRFPLRPGVAYRAILNVDGRQREAVFRIPAPSSDPSTELRYFYPSRGDVPENLLKIYLHFTAPMARGEARHRVRLLDSSGRSVNHPFLELEEELWDGSGMRLTLIFDPGRIRRGLKPRQEEGPILEEGKSYILSVDGGWPDAEGRPLIAGKTKRFSVTAPDERQPDPQSWTLDAPKVGSRDALVVRFRESLDEAMLNGVLVVVDQKRRRVRGRIAIEDRETLWRFIPRDPWKAGRYELLVDATLEDLAGNNIARPFEVDVFRRVERAIPVETLRLPFTVR